MEEPQKEAKTAPDGDNRPDKAETQDKTDAPDKADAAEATPINAKPDDTLQTLEAAAKGLLFMSESDRPLTPFVWDEKTSDAPDAIAALVAVTGADKKAVKTLTVAEFFKPMTEAQDWMGDEEKAGGARFAVFVGTLNKTLTGAQAFRIEGDPVIDAYVIGKDAAGRWAGVSTQLVET